jgi:hypothetical protein
MPRGRARRWRCPPGTSQASRPLQQHGQGCRAPEGRTAHAPEHGVEAGPVGRDPRLPAALLPPGARQPGGRRTAGRGVHRAPQPRPARPCLRPCPRPTARAPGAWSWGGPARQAAPSRPPIPIQPGGLFQARGGPRCAASAARQRPGPPPAALRCPPLEPAPARWGGARAWPAAVSALHARVWAPSQPGLQLLRPDQPAVGRSGGRAVKAHRAVGARGTASGRRQRVRQGAPPPSQPQLQALAPLTGTRGWPGRGRRTAQTRAPCRPGC